MGGGGGSSSSSSNTSQTYNTDKRLVVDQGVGVSSDSSTVNVAVTDLNAIANAFGFATGAGKTAATTVDNALAFSTGAQNSVAGTMDKVLGLADVILKGSMDAVKGTNAVVSQAYETAKTTNTGSIDQKTMMVLAVVAAGAFVMGKK